MTQITTNPKFKTLCYDTRGYSDVQSRINTDLANWELSNSHWALEYDTGTSIFVVGEVVTGAVGVGTVVGLAAGSTSATGTLYLELTTPGFVGAEAIAGSITGAASVVAATSEQLIPMTIGSIRVATSKEEAVVGITYSPSIQV